MHEGVSTVVRLPNYQRIANCSLWNSVVPIDSELKNQSYDSLKTPALTSPDLDVPQKTLEGCPVRLRSADLMSQK
jgi:hypothetical protein